ncbi:hypothetical protein D3C73_1226750 [compost metagenome]
MLTPYLDAFIAKIVLVGFIQGKADKQLPIGNNRFIAGKFVAFCWPVTDKLHPFRDQLVVQHSQRIQEPFTVTQLIAHAVESNNFAFQVEVIQLIPDGFPVLLDFAEIPGWDT